MKFRELRDPDRLHALIDAILLMETDAALSTLLLQIVTTASELVGARTGRSEYWRATAPRSQNSSPAVSMTRRRPASATCRPARGVLGETIRAAQPLRIDNLAQHEGAVGFPQNHPAMSRFLGVPVITRNGHIWGNLYVTEPTNGEPFSHDDELLLETFGRVAGAVIDQSNLRRELRELSVAEERERLARDLHDTVIQRLFGVGLGLQMALPS